MMGGLDSPTSGSVIINGEDISQKSAEQLTVFRRRHIGFVFQNYNLVPVLNVYENIVLPVQLDGKKVDKKLMDEIVEVLGLQDKLENLPNNLSGASSSGYPLPAPCSPNRRSFWPMNPREIWTAKQLRMFFLC